MRFYLLMGIFLVFTSTANTEPLKESIAFKGIPLGKGDVSEQLMSLCLEKISNKGKGIFANCEKKKESQWSFIVDYGNLVEVYASFGLDAAKGITYIDMYSVNKSSISALVELLESKYGKPSTTVNTVTNQMGMKFDNTNYVWLDGEGNQITIQSIYRSVNNARVLIESAALVKAKSQMNEIMKEVGKSNL